LTNKAFIYITKEGSEKKMAEECRNEIVVDGDVTEIVMDSDVTEIVMGIDNVER